MPVDGRLEARGPHTERGQAMAGVLATIGIGLGGLLITAVLIGAIPSGLAFPFAIVWGIGESVLVARALVERSSRPKHPGWRATTSV